MIRNNPRQTITIDNTNSKNWKSYLENELKKINSNTIEIDCKNTDLLCKDILDIIEISKKFNCQIISFFSTSPKTIVSTQSLGYKSQFLPETYLNKSIELNKEHSEFSKTHFHQGTVRSGEYINCSGDLMILGDVNPGAVVSAEGNVIIWGRLLGIAHAGSQGNAKATIAALQLRPVQLRIANKIARGPQEKTHLGFAEQAAIVSEKIVISLLEDI